MSLCCFGEDSSDWMAGLLSPIIYTHYINYKVYSSKQAWQCLVRVMDESDMIGGVTEVISHLPGEQPGVSIYEKIPPLAPSSVPHGSVLMSGVCTAHLRHQTLVSYI